MAFRFSLDGLLRMRQSLERQQELLLLEANHHVRKLEQQKDDLNAALAASAKQEMEGLASGLSAAELQFELLCRSALMQKRGKLEKDIADARAAREIRVAALRQARQQREVIESLRRRQCELYRRVESRQQQREVDDLFLRLSPIRLFGRSAR
jgi:flagellar export protein FliJ